MHLSYSEYLIIVIINSCVIVYKYNRYIKIEREKSELYITFKKEGILNCSF